MVALAFLVLIDPSPVETEDVAEKLENAEIDANTVAFTRRRLGVRIASSPSVFGVLWSNASHEEDGIVADDEEEKLPTDEELPTSVDEELEDFLAYLNRKLKASSAERLAAYDEISRKIRKWDLEGRDLERRKVATLEALLKRERVVAHRPDTQLSFSKDDLERFVGHRKVGLATKSLDWIKRSSKDI